MRAGLTEDRNRAVRGNHRRWMLQNALQVLLVDGMEDGETFALLDHPQRGISGVLHRRFELASYRHLAQPPENDELDFGDGQPGVTEQGESRRQIRRRLAKAGNGFPMNISS